MLGLSFLKGDKAMSEKRRDNRNRILHEGEYQRADGRYRFRYVDMHGNEGNLYYIVMELIQGKTLKQIISEDRSTSLEMVCKYCNTNSFCIRSSS